MPVKQPVYRALTAVAEETAAVERSVAYVAEKMHQFLKKNEKVLICFPRLDNACCHILEQAIRACECNPIWLGEDRRWLAILKLSFTERCNCIVAPPLMLLGLSKVAKHMGIPLFFRNALYSGYPATEWMIRAIERGLDCKTWGCYDPGLGAVISGFTCEKGADVHIREEEYGVEILDEAGNAVSDGETGYVWIYPKEKADLRFRTGHVGRLDRSICACGCNSPRLIDLDLDKGSSEALSDMGESLHYWSSILDCRLERTGCGLELEAIVFQGEKLPKFPSCAKMVIRPWAPEKDEPLDHYGALKNQLLTGFDH